jgi:hypothetical protein
MTRRTLATGKLAGTLMCVLGTHAALAGGPKSAPAPHASAPAPHAAAAARPAMGGSMGTSHAPIMGAGHAPMGSARPAMSQSRFATQGANRPSMGPGHGGSGAGHFGAAQGHAGPSGLHTESRSEHNGGIGGEIGHRDAEHGEGARAEAHGAGREEIARDDPARAHGRFDEHVRNPEREHDIERLHGHDFHVRDVRYFNDREWGRWRGGYWHRDYYDGRFGWWYDVGGVYYPYAAPIWPYPLSVAPLIVAEAAAAPPPPMPIAPLPALPRVAYHCASPAGFYPEVGACDAGWATLAAH